MSQLCCRLTLCFLICGALIRDSRRSRKDQIGGAGIEPELLIDLYSGSAGIF